MTMPIKQRQHSLPGFDLDYFVEESIDFLRRHEPQEGYFVGFSGGKDSIVTLELCRMAGVKHEAYFTHTGIEPPELLKFIRAHYPQVRWLRPAKSFFAFVQTNAPPYECSAGAANTSKNVLPGLCLSMCAFLGYGPKNLHAEHNVGVLTLERLQVAVH